MRSASLNPSQWWLCFQDFMAGKLEPLPGKYPTMADWLNQLNSILSEVRLLEPTSRKSTP